MKIELTDDEYFRLLYLLGIAGGAADTAERTELVQSSIDLANKFIAAKRQPAEEDDDDGHKYSLRPDLPRCRMKARNSGNAPCLGPATRPGGLCPAHFLRWHGHDARYSRPEERGPMYQFCKLCGKKWNPKDRAVLQEFCPKKPKSKEPNVQTS